MTRFSRGVVVLVRFPFTDLQSSKQRPALVLSTEEFHQRESDVVLVAITSSRVGRLGQFDHLLEDWKGAGLLRASVARAGKVVTLEGSLIRSALGRLSEPDFRAVESLTRRVLGLT